MREKIIEIVNEFGPIKATEIVVRFMTNNEPDQNITDVLDELVKNGDIIEVEYTLPQMNYCVKSMYFPKGTEVQITKGFENSKNETCEHPKTSSWGRLVTCLVCGHEWINNE
jgi:hypothetical protein